MTREKAIDEAVRCEADNYTVPALYVLKAWAGAGRLPMSAAARIRAEFRRIMERERSTDYLRRMGYPVG
jgi:hypothetical protein